MCEKLENKHIQYSDVACSGTELVIESNKALEDAYVGCSIAVNGVCLTATSFIDNKVGIPTIKLFRMSYFLYG